MVTLIKKRPVKTQSIFLLSSLNNGNVTCNVLHVSFSALSN